MRDYQITVITLSALINFFMNRPIYFNWLNKVFACTLLGFLATTMQLPLFKQLLIYWNNNDQLNVVINLSLAAAIVGMFWTTLANMIGQSRVPTCLWS